MDTITLEEIFHSITRFDCYSNTIVNYEACICGNKCVVKYRKIGKSKTYSVLIDSYEITYRFLSASVSIYILDKNDQKRKIIHFSDNDGFDVPLKKYISSSVKSAKK